MGNSISISCIFRLSFDLLFLKNFQSHHSGPKGRCSGMTRSFYLHSVSDPDSDQTSISRQCCCFNQVPICHRNCHLQIIKTAFCHFLHLLTKRLCSNQKLSRCNWGIEKTIPIPGTAFLNGLLSYYCFSSRHTFSTATVCGNMSTGCTFTVS